MQKGKDIVWPRACLGCGTESKLNDYSENVQLSHRAPGVIKAPAEFYLCTPCEEYAQREQKHLRIQGIIGIFILILALLPLPLFITSLEGIPGIATGLTLATWILLIISRIEKTVVYVRRKPIHSYYRTSWSSRTRTSTLFFRNDIFSVIFSSVNPFIPNVTNNAVKITDRLGVEWSCGNMTGPVFFGFLFVGFLTLPPLEYIILSGWLIFVYLVLFGFDKLYWNLFERSRNPKKDISKESD